MSEKQIPIDRLRPGMYITGLDIAWIDTPFLVHKLLIKSDEQIRELTACGAKLITIDTDRGDDVVEEQPAEETPAAPAAETPPKATALVDELESAKKLRDSTQQLITEAWSTVREGGAVTESMFLPAIAEAIASIGRNRLALLTLFHQKGKGQDMINHAFSQMSLGLMIGEQLGLSNEELERVGMAALMMDVGWALVSDDYYSLQYAYTDDEFEKVKEHVSHSVQILEDGDFDPEVINLVAHHHERFDGTGYPNGLRGLEISAKAQLLSLINHFEASVHGLYDQSPNIPAKALRFIYEKGVKGGHDPALVKTLIGIVGIYPISSAVELNTGERGVVTRVNWKKPMLPRVKIVYGRDRQALYKPYELDLANQPLNSDERKIERVLDPSDPKADPLGRLNIDEE